MSPIMRAKREANRDLPLPIKEERENILLSIIYGWRYHISLLNTRDPTFNPTSNLKTL